ncbi:MAG: hypothetical protein M3317_14375 [Actinomycetota bacterium]|nr:hypothetical protein [Actinomycetota bacterium]
MKKMKLMLLVIAMLAAMVAGAAPAFAEQQGAAEEEIAVTGVVKDGPEKADGTPTYGIMDESTIYGYNRHDGYPLGVGYLLEGDYGAYVGQRITVYGIPRIEPGSPSMRILDVTRIG